MEHRNHEYLIAGGFDWEGLTGNQELLQDAEFISLLRRLQPDVIHFHHYYMVGLELIRVSRMACPDAKLILTLHEFMAICTNDGMMVRPDMSLCYRASPRDCQQCFPARGADWFFLRERYTKSFFALIDLFISPSNFLAERYVEWGVPKEKMRVLENGILSGERVPPRPLKRGERRTRFAFFGQAHPYKGLDLILEALGGLPPEIRREITLDVHASGLDRVKFEYSSKVKRLLKKHSDFVRYHGPYEQRDLPRLMQDTDWVVMASVWWENSPVVIQEARKFGRPVICPDLGGMGEKVEEGVGGLKFQARSAASLRYLVRRIAETPDMSTYTELIARLPDYTTVERAASAHLAVYKDTDGSLRKMTS